MRSVGPVIAMVADDGVMRISAVTRRRNILTGRVTATVRGGSAAIPDFGRAVPLSRVLVSGNADAVYVLWQDGAFVRFDTRNLREPASPSAATCCATMPCASRWPASCWAATPC